MNQTKYIPVVKHAVYSLLLLLFYVIQTTPRLFQIMGVKPLWVVPVAIAIAMHEGEFAGGVYGAIAGLLCDTGGFTLFGYNGLIISAACIAIGLLVIYLMRCNVGACLLYVALVMLIRGSIGYFFAYGIWNYESAWKIYVYQTLPTVIYTMVAAVPVYYLIHRLYRRFADWLTA